MHARDKLIMEFLNLIVNKITDFFTWNNEFSQFLEKISMSNTMFYVFFFMNEEKATKFDNINHKF